MARYTLATGEPIWAGFLRTPPGPDSGRGSTRVHLFQLGWPGWALAAGTTAAALFLGRSPRHEDHVVVLALGYLLFAAAVGAVLLGRRGQGLLWHADRIFLVGTLLFLAILAVVLVPPPVWRAVTAGFLGPFVGMPRPPGDLDWPLLTAFAAYSGAGGVVNASPRTGCATRASAWPASVAARRAHRRSPASSGVRDVRLDPSEGNPREWREWWRYLGLHLGFLWVLGPMAAMALPVLLTAHLVPFVSNMQGGAAPSRSGARLGADGNLWLVPHLLAGCGSSSRPSAASPRSSAASPRSCGRGAIARGLGGRAAFRLYHACSASSRRRAGRARPRRPAQARDHRRQRGRARIRDALPAHAWANRRLAARAAAVALARGPGGGVRALLRRAGGPGCWRAARRPRPLR